MNKRYSWLAGRALIVLLLWTAILVGAVAVHGQDSGSGLDVWLTVNNALDEDRSEPVTSGVPIPQSIDLIDLSGLRLLDAGGTLIPAQFTPLARWGGGPEDASKPARWLLLDFQVSVAAGKSALVHLVDQGGDNAPFPTLVVNDGAEALTIDTGVTQFTISKTTGGLSAPTFDSHAPLMGNLTDENAIPYATVGPVSVRVTRSGPMRISVEVKGAYRSGEGAPLLDYTMRYWFFAGQPLARMFHTLENNTLCPLVEYEQIDCYEIDSGGSVSFDDLSLTMRLAPGLDTSYQFGPESGALNNNLLVYQDSSGSDHWDHYLTLTDWEGNRLDTRPRLQAYVNFRGYRMTLGDSQLAQGDQAVDSLNLTGDDRSWGIGVRDLWQNFPKALRAAPDGSLEVGLFPREFGGDDYAFRLRAGEHKTHEIWLNVSGHLPTRLEPLFAQASPEWYIESGGFGLTALPNPTDWRDHETYIVNQLDTAATYEDWMDWHPNLFATIEAADFYGIYDYGDWPIDYEGYGVSPLNVKYDNDFGAWIQWARGGDGRWFALAEALDRHTADLDILHNRHEPRHWGDGIIFGHSYHDEEGFVNPHRNYGGASPDTAYGMQGMLLTYYLTGYEKTYQSALELADNIAYRVGNDFYLCSYFPAGECNGSGWALAEGMYDAGCRPAANSLSILVAAYRATGEQRYLHIADALVDWARPETQPYINGPTGEDLAVRPWMINMYLRQLAYYLDMRQEFGLPDTVNAAGSYLGFADWLREYAWINLEPIDSGARAAYPYEWWFDGRQGDTNDEWAVGNNIPSINNWLLLGADAMAYAYHLSGNADYLDYAEQLFRTGSRNPFFVGDFLTFSSTKETANSVTFGNVFLHEWGQR